MPSCVDFLSLPFSVPPYRLSGTVYGALLNHRSALDALGDAANRAPYNSAPRAPVLYIKPRNTLALPGDSVEVPAGMAELEVGASVGLVMARAACRVREDDALDHIAGYLIVADVSVPHSNFHRPSVRFKARDRFCPIGPAITPSAVIRDVGALYLRTYIDGVLAQTASTADLIRSATRLVADVTEFMTLAAGDMLALGAASPAPRVRPGQNLRIEIDGLGSLCNSFVAAVP